MRATALQCLQPIWNTITITIIFWDIRTVRKLFGWPHHDRWWGLMCPPLRTNDRDEKSNRKRGYNTNTPGKLSSSVFHINSIAVRLRHHARRAEKLLKRLQRLGGVVDKNMSRVSFLERDTIQCEHGRDSKIATQEFISRFVVVHEGGI